MKALGLGRDVWDRFALLDAEYYLPILVNNLYLSPEDQMLIIWFTVYSVREDLISYWDMPQGQLVAEFLQFCQEHNAYMGRMNIYRFFELLKTMDSKELDAGAIITMDNLIESFYDHMRGQGKMREFKKDYSD